MTYLKRRITALEKIYTPKTIDLYNIILKVIKRGDKTFYIDRFGNEKEYIENEHQDSKILIYLNGISPPGN